MKEFLIIFTKHFPGRFPVSFRCIDLISAKSSKIAIKRFYSSRNGFKGDHTVKVWKCFEIKKSGRERLLNYKGRVLYLVRD